MHKTKLLRTLNTLTPDEWSSFRKYLLMHTRKGSDNFDFFEYLHIRKSRLHTMTDADAVREKHFSQMTSKGFSNMMSRLFNWLEEWLSIEEFKRQRYQEELMLIKSYNRRGLYKLANSNADKLEKIIKGETQLDLENNKAIYTLNHIKYYSNNPSKVKYGSEIMQNLITSYHASIKEHLLLYSPEIYNLSRIQNKDLTSLISNNQEVISKIQPSEISDILFELEKLITDPNLKSFNTLFDVLKSNKLKEPSYLHTLISYYLMASSLNLWTKNISKTTHSIGEIYDYVLEKNILNQNGKIPLSMFINITSILSGIKDYNWVNNFIDSNYRKVNTSSHQDLKQLCYAQNCFYHKKYHLIIDHIINIKDSDINIKIKSICLHAVAFYKAENINYDILEVKLNNFKRLLKRNKSKFSSHFFKAHYNFITVVNILIQQKFKNIELDLNQYPQLIMKKWILEEVKK